jgi:hypothetical protein
MRDQRIVAFVGAFGLGCAVIFGCGGSSSPTENDDLGDVCERQDVHGTTLFPDSTLEDWVSFADHVASVQVIAEEVIPPPAEVQQRGEGYVGRKITVQTIQTIWSNSFAPALDGQFAFNVIGWVLKEECVDLVPAAVTLAHPAPRLELHGKYVVALVRYTVLAEGWGPLTPASAFPMDGDQVATADVKATGNNFIAQELSEESIATISSLLESEPPHVAVLDFLQLPAEERLARAGSN